MLQGPATLFHLTPGKEKHIMALRDLIPWSRQENRLSDAIADTRSGPDYHPLRSLHREVNRLFDDVFSGFGRPAFAGFERSLAWPHASLEETDRAIRVTAKLPGLTGKDIDISVEEGLLTLRGEKRSDVEDKNRGYRERSYGRFEHRIALPRNIDRDKANATFERGVLTITLPKSAEAKDNVRRIPVNAAAA
jgi:HSP20 family protein